MRAYRLRFCQTPDNLTCSMILIRDLRGIPSRTVCRAWHLNTISIPRFFATKFLFTIDYDPDERVENLGRKICMKNLLERPRRINNLSRKMQISIQTSILGFKRLENRLSCVLQVHGRTFQFSLERSQSTRINDSATLFLKCCQFELEVNNKFPSIRSHSSLHRTSPHVNGSSTLFSATMQSKK